VKDEEENENKKGSEKVRKIKGRKTNATNEQL
jgi:hypothetical protein